MEVESWIASATKALARAGIKTARLDVLVLTENVINKDRSWLLAHPTDEITKFNVNKLNKLVIQRATHYPLAYITNKSYFYNNEFYVDDHVLVPRPESETIIDILKSLKLTKKHTIIDVGTGSGALAITAKLLFPKSSVMALDIDPSCLKIAKTNSASFDAHITFLQSDLLKSLPVNSAANSVMLVNLPYVPTDFPINDSADFEPRTAIFGGIDGLELYTGLFGQINCLSLKPNYMITESFPSQHSALQAIAKKVGYELNATSDYIQLFSHRR